MQNKKKQQAVGVIDSGVGGLSVLKHLQSLLPQEHYIYAADSLYAPYGSRSSEAILARCQSVTTFLLEHDIKALVVACNTATVAAIQVLRKQYDLPIIGMEPAVKPAAAATKNGRIGILATTGTLKSAQFAALLDTYGQHVQVFTQACEGLVECVERGELISESTLDLLRRYCAPLQQAEIDTIVLGCTHYPFLKPAIEQIVGKHITLIDTGAAVAKQLARRLSEAGLLRDASHDRTVIDGFTFYSNSERADVASIVEILCEQNQNIEIIQTNF